MSNVNSKHIKQSIEKHLDNLDSKLDKETIDKLRLGQIKVFKDGDKEFDKIRLMLGGISSSVNRSLREQLKMEEE